MTEPIVLALPSEVIEEVARRAAEIVVDQVALPDRERWPEYMDVPTAAAYLGCTEGRVRKLYETRRIPHHQEAPGCRVFVKRTDLDEWMQVHRTTRGG